MKKNFKVMALAGLAAVVAVGGTFAYYTASQTFENPFDTTYYDTASYEKFNPSEGQEWKPGAKVDKVVTASNTGEGDVFVRVWLDEEWTLKGNNGLETKTRTLNSKEDNFNPASANAGIQATTISKEDDGAKDGVVEEKDSVVFKDLNLLSITEENKNNPNSWVEQPNKWVHASDGYYYYTSALPGKKTAEATAAKTEPLLNSVTLCKDADMGKFVHFGCFTIVREDDFDSTTPPTPVWDEDTGKFKLNTPDEKTWGLLDEDDAIPMNNDKTKVKLNGEEKEVSDGETVYSYKTDARVEDRWGYADANYVLNIKVEYVQADENGEAALAQSDPWTIEVWKNYNKAE